MKFKQNNIWERNAKLPERHLITAILSLTLTRGAKKDN